MLANYGVQHGYQLWYMQQDHNKLLVFSCRDVSEGKCVGLKGKKSKIDDNKECETSKQGSKKGDDRKAMNKIINKVVKERWDKKKKYKKNGSLNKVIVPLGCGPYGYVLRDHSKLRAYTLTTSVAEIIQWRHWFLRNG
ncbi:hypothetical protein Tco_1455077 [Tanacetum coccineum]